jgi:hypothetical protein
LLLTVAVPVFADDHVAPWSLERVCLLPSLRVAVAVICWVAVRPTAHGSGEMLIAETCPEEVDAPHAMAARASEVARMIFMGNLSSIRASVALKGTRLRA